MIQEVVQTVYVTESGEEFNNYDDALAIDLQNQLLKYISVESMQEVTENADFVYEALKNFIGQKVIYSLR